MLGARPFSISSMTAKIEKRWLMRVSTRYIQRSDADLFERSFRTPFHADFVAQSFTFHTSFGEFSLPRVVHRCSRRYTYMAENLRRRSYDGTSRGEFRVSSELLPLRARPPAYRVARSNVLQIARGDFREDSPATLDSHGSEIQARRPVVVRETNSEDGEEGAGGTLVGRSRVRRTAAVHDLVKCLETYVGGKRQS